MLPMVRAPVLQDHSVNDLPTENAFPTEKMSPITIKFFINHYSSASMAPHMDPLGFRKANDVPKTALLEPMVGEGALISLRHPIYNLVSPCSTEKKEPSIVSSTIIFPYNSVLV